ncbi:GTP-binding protein [Grimontia hollisae]|uniref:Uncharacterized GTP-binding protein YjiA n=2 Tax=Grimontia hollisae TaxID=673 RepID=A0A377J784_GRIHO|nr:GTP-binding protein [Grimontia hollisae]AMG28944.1 GTP-binding protein [Grimontia hollisae]EEY71844.1 Putative GTPase (G3E family) [Grimontia hollisae CIP 101886]STO77210.1 Uncharacterized GTP-binding protein YjiA [Grimontia hollisae]STO98352.1 Uncharacterized GTP-binding protein YjiA [Grimontia hollisae]STQ75825.1 Uncharacterized GTP-binding protein YjiA [Grimontia hollisae]
MIPIHVITGFLGSGKTTLLQQMVNSSFFSNAALLVNEFGEVGIDHLILNKISKNTILLDNGCICCSILSNLSDALNDLLNQREKKIIPAFDRIIIETTGLAEPSPIIATITQSPMLKHNFKIASIVTVVDLSMPEIADDIHNIWVSQVSASNIIVYSKSDISTKTLSERIKKKVSQITLDTECIDSSESGAITDLLSCREDFSSLSKEFTIKKIATIEVHNKPNYVSTSLSNIHTFSIEYDRQISWSEFGLWLSMLLNRHGKNILRIKGILSIEGHTNPISLHGVQHVIYDPVEMEKSQILPENSVIIFITNGITKKQITDSIEKMLSLVN